MRALRLLAVLALAGCPTADDGVDDTDPVETDDTEVGDTDTDGPSTFVAVQAVFDASCATYGCHTGDGAPEGLQLTPGASYAGLVGVDSTEQPTRKRVAPGDLDGSWLWHKVNGTMTDVDATDGTDAMPPPFGLAGDDLAAIRAWIEAGAPE